MIDLTRTTGQKLLFEGKHEQAIPAAMQSLRFAIQVHGLASIELVPSYLILGEASIGGFQLRFLMFMQLKRRLITSVSLFSIVKPSRF